MRKEEEKHNENKTGVVLQGWRYLSSNSSSDLLHVAYYCASSELWGLFPSITTKDSLAKNFIHTEPESDKRHLQFFPYAYYNLLIHYQEERVEKSI